MQLAPGVCAQQRHRTMLQPQQNAGRACPKLKMAKSCFTGPCGPSIERKPVTAAAKARKSAALNYYHTIWRSQFLMEMNNIGSCSYLLVRNLCLGLGVVQCLACAEGFMAPVGSCEPQTTRFYCKENEGTQKTIHGKVLLRLHKAYRAPPLPAPSPARATGGGAVGMRIVHQMRMTSRSSSSSRSSSGRSDAERSSSSSSLSSGSKSKSKSKSSPVDTPYRDIDSRAHALQKFRGSGGRSVKWHFVPQVLTPSVQPTFSPTLSTQFQRRRWKPFPNSNSADAETSRLDVLREKFVEPMEYNQAQLPPLQFDGG